jgi:hypothetical protein
LRLKKVDNFHAEPNSLPTSLLETLLCSLLLLGGQCQGKGECEAGQWNEGQIEQGGDENTSINKQ